MMNGGVPQGGGVSGFGVAEEEETPFSGTGGAAGAGTRAGEGEPSGEGIGIAPTDTPALGTGNEAAREAAALGSAGDHDRTPALEYGEADRPNPPTIGEAIGSGTGEDVGSGLRDCSGLGSGSPVTDAPSSTDNSGGEIGST